MKNHKAVFGLAKSDEHATRIINRLQDAGFNTECLSVVVFDRDSRLTRKTVTGELETNPEYFSKSTPVRQKRGTLSHEKHTKAPEGATTGAVTGGIIGGAIGLLAGLGAIAIPGLGALVAAGPILAALSGSAVGGGVGLLVGALAGLGIPEFEAKKYVDSLKAGHILICVDAANSKELSRAKEILEQEHAEDVSVVRESAGAHAW